MQKRSFHTLSIIFAANMLSGCMGFSLSTPYWDSKVDELCKADGGGHIYMAVELPRTEYSQYLNRSGELQIPQEWQTFTGNVKPSYFEKLISKDINSGRPSVNRTAYQVIRRSDQAVIAEFVTYTRWGGELIIPTIVERGIPQYRCPKEYHFQFFRNVIKERLP